jgi:mono/diheme cytochrome c family protein
LRVVPWRAAGHTWRHPDRHLFEITKFGGEAKAPPGFRSNMPGFAGKLTDADIWAALAYIKSRWPAEVRRRQAAINDRFDKR